MTRRLPDPGFWSRQRVLLTGHTGFKGAWLSLWLERMGATVHGLSLAPDTDPSLFDLLQPFTAQTSQFGDIRDRQTVADAVHRCDPTVVIHMAAQPLVRRSYREPLETLATNVMGTAHVLDALREVHGLKAALIITTDKVYANMDDDRAFVETDRLGGKDPYSASKASAELVTHSWSESFLQQVPVATARAGNVIGGGDWSVDRIIPDIWRANRAGRVLELRYPDATRPWQHVLDALCGYLLYAEALAQGEKTLPDALNFGPPPQEKMTVSQIVDAFHAAAGTEKKWVKVEATLHEMNFLGLDPDLAMKTLGWAPKFDAPGAVGFTVAWYHALDGGADPRRLTLEQIETYES